MTGERGPGFEEMVRQEGEDSPDTTFVPESVFKAQLEVNSRFPQKILDGPMFIYLANAVANDESIKIEELLDAEVSEEQRQELHRVIGAQHRQHGIEVGVNEHVVEVYVGMMAWANTGILEYIKEIVQQPLWKKLGMQAQMDPFLEGVMPSTMIPDQDGFFSSGKARECLRIVKDVVSMSYDALHTEPVTRLAGSYKRAVSKGFRDERLATTYIFDIRQAVLSTIIEKLKEQYPEAKDITEEDVAFLYVLPQHLT